MTAAQLLEELLYLQEYGVVLEDFDVVVNYTAFDNISVHGTGMNISAQSYPDIVELDIQRNELLLT